MVRLQIAKTIPKTNKAETQQLPGSSSEKEAAWAPIESQYALVSILCTQKGLQEGSLVVRMRVAETMPEDVE